MDNISVKWKLGDQLRRFTIKRAPDGCETLFESLQRHARAVAGDTNFGSITWQDEDGDLIVIGSDVELAEALSHRSGDILRITSESVETSTPQAPPPQPTNGPISDEPIPPSAQQETPQAQAEQQAAAPGVEHIGVTCDCCDSRIFGHRYKCIMCADYDLCRQCEGTGVHSHHAMLRIADPEITMVPWGARLRSRYQVGTRNRDRAHHSQAKKTFGGKPGAASGEAALVEQFSRGMDFLSQMGQTVSKALTNMGTTYEIRDPDGNSIHVSTTAPNQAPATQPAPNAGQAAPNAGQAAPTAAQAPPTEAPPKKTTPTQTPPSLATPPAQKKEKPPADKDTDGLSKKKLKEAVQESAFRDAFARVNEGRAREIETARKLFAARDADLQKRKADKDAERREKLEKEREMREQAQRETQRKQLRKNRDAEECRRKPFPYEDDDHFRAPPTRGFGDRTGVSPPRFGSYPMPPRRGFGFGGRTALSPPRNCGFGRHSEFSPPRRGFGDDTGVSAPNRRYGEPFGSAPRGGFGAGRCRRGGFGGRGRDDFGRFGASDFGRLPNRFEDEDDVICREATGFGGRTGRSTFRGDDFNRPAAGFGFGRRDEDFGGFEGRRGFGFGDNEKNGYKRVGVEFKATAPINFAEWQAEEDKRLRKSASDWQKNSFFGCESGSSGYPKGEKEKKKENDEKKEREKEEEEAPLDSDDELDEWLLPREKKPNPRNPDPVAERSVYEKGIYELARKNFANGVVGPIYIADANGVIRPYHNPMYRDCFREFENEANKKKNEEEKKKEEENGKDEFGVPDFESNTEHSLKNAIYSDSDESVNVEESTDSDSWELAGGIYSDTEPNERIDRIAGDAPPSTLSFTDPASLTALRLNVPASLSLVPAPSTAIVPVPTAPKEEEKVKENEVQSAASPVIQVEKIYPDLPNMTEVDKQLIEAKRTLTKSLVGMGFTAPEIKRAILHCGCELEKCIDYLTEGSQ